MANTERSFEVGRIQALQAVGSPSCPPLPGRSPSVPSTVLSRDTRMGQSSSGGGGPGGDQQVLGTGLQAGGAPGPHSSGQLCWRLPRRQSRLTREESLVGQGGEGWEKGDKGPGLAMVCRHHFLASNTKLKQAGEALAPTPGVGGASRLASALS